jgi:hypothetical protein
LRVLPGAEEITVRLHGGNSNPHNIGEENGKAFVAMEFLESSAQDVCGANYG